MADLNKFQRSKERITEILNYFRLTREDINENSFIANLERSLHVIDRKMEELESKELLKNGLSE